MRTLSELAELSRLDHDVLSVYVAREHTDPGKADAWRKRLLADAAAARARTDDAAAFDRALGRVTGAMESLGRVLPSAGWAVLATSDRVYLSEGLPTAPIPLVRWQRGAYIGPYLPALEYRWPVIVALADRWRARLFRYEAASLAEVGDLIGHPDRFEEIGSGMRKGAASASGMRGATRTDAARRALAEEEERFRKRVVGEVLALAGSSAGVAVGGSKDTVRALVALLGDSIAGRVGELGRVGLTPSNDELRTSVEEAASRLLEARHGRLLESLGENPGGRGRGWNEVRRALTAHSVETLVVSERLLGSSPDDVEELVTLAVAQGANVVTARGEPGARLLEEADGVAAKLRFGRAPAS